MSLARTGAAAAALALLIAAPAAAQQYPSQTITITVAAAAGGFADGVARLVGEKLGERLGQSVVVENKGGAGGNLGARLVAQAKPDGHAILVSTTSMAINPTLYKSMGYAADDIRPVAIVGSAPEAVAVHPGNPAKTMADVVQQAKSGPVQFGTAGVGSGSHIAAEYFFRAIAKVESTHVPFPGGAPAIQAAVGGHVPVVVATLPPLVPHINSGALRGVGIASPKRLEVVADVPTFTENGFADFHAASWVGFFVPSKTGDAVVDRLNGTINEILKDPGVQERMAKFGLEPMFGTTAETTRFFRSEVDHWGKMVRTLNLTIN